MILIAASILTIATIWNSLHWRAMQEQRIRWQLYALRDRLRWAAIVDRGLLNSRLFWTLDRAMTRDCRGLEDLTLWSLLPGIIISRRRPAELEEQRRQTHLDLKRPENREIAGIYDEAAKLLFVHLCLRHIVLLLLLLVTVLGPIVLFVWFKQLAKDMSLGGLTPSRGARASRTSIPV